MSNTTEQADAVDYMRGAKRLEIKIRQEQQELGRLKNAAIGKNGIHMEQIVAKYTDMEEKLQTDLCDLQERRIEIMNTIHKLDDSLCLIILHAKWLDGESLEQISVKIGYSFPHVRRKYWEGMQKIKKMLNKEEITRNERR